MARFTLDQATEWQECRTTIARFDGSLSATRQYGFTLVTVLLTANALITTGDTAVDRPAASIVVMALLLALFMLDNYYWDLLRAAVKRAEKLEKDGGGQISWDLSRSAARAHLTGVILGVYVVYVLVAVFIAVTGVWEAKPLAAWGYIFLAVATVIELGSMLVIYGIVQQPTRPAWLWTPISQAVKALFPDPPSLHDGEAGGTGKAGTA